MISWIRQHLALCLAVIIYLPTLIWHKIGVLLAGIFLNKQLKGTGFHVPIHRLIFHDWVKFSFAELTPYARRYYSSNLKCNIVGRIANFLQLPRLLGPVECPPSMWEEALRHHYHRMDHHIEYYTSGRIQPIVPDEAVVEMVADRMGASWGYDGCWPEPGTNWKRLGDSFSQTNFPTHRSRALYFAICCIAGYESTFDSIYSWENCKVALSSHLVQLLQERVPETD